MSRVVILGCGFTGRRVAQLLRSRGWETFCTNRRGEEAFQFDANDPESLTRLAAAMVDDAIVLHSIPVRGVMEAMRKSRPRRIVYLSTTSVYGAAPKVDESTPAAPRTERELARAAEEADVLNGPWQAMVLRPAAIYGPGRGIHVSMQAGKYRLLETGDNFVSRIHVDDLAAHAEAALLSNLTGAYPVADGEPCTSREIALYCAKLLGLDMPEPAAAEDLGETRRADRRVDGSAIRRLLGLTLKYPSYREGIAACLEEEARAFSTS